MQLCLNLGYSWVVDLFPLSGKWFFKFCQFCSEGRILMKCVFQLLNLLHLTSSADLVDGSPNAVAMYRKWAVICPWELRGRSLLVVCGMYEAPSLSESLSLDIIATSSQFSSCQQCHTHTILSVSRPDHFPVLGTCRCIYQLTGPLTRLMWILVLLQMQHNQLLFMV